MYEYKVFFLIVAAGKGQRMGVEKKKQYLSLGDLPILGLTLSRFISYTGLHDIILVVPEKDMSYCRETILKPIGLENKAYLVPGGKERQESVFNGIQKILSLNCRLDKDLLLIHDGVRPFINNDLIDSCIKGAAQFKACVPAIRTVDTIKSVKDNLVIKTLDRDSVYQVQTPQAFLLKTIVGAMNHAIKNDFSGTDDASLVEYCGEKVAIINGLRRNIKITTKEDLEFAKACLAME